MVKDNDEQPGEKKPKVAKTKLYRKPQTGEELPQEQEISPAPPPEEPKPEAPKPKVAKTRLDLKLISDIRSQFGLRENDRMQQEIQKRELEPVKIVEPIEAQRKVRSCPFSWTAESDKERFKYCGDCRTPIYHLDGLEPEQVDALILKRENLENFVLYARPDGKYMTSDCPVARKKRVQVVALAAAVGLCIIAAVAVAITMPPPPPPTASAPTAASPTSGSTNETTAPTAVTSDSESSKGGSSTPGTHHYEAGDPIPVVPTSAPSRNKAEPRFSEHEQSGEFWQFPNGQPADDFSRRAGSSSGN